MPEENTNEELKEEKSPSTKEKKKGLNLFPIIIGGGVFVAFLVIFSFLFGVFSSDNVKPTTAENQPAPTPAESLKIEESVHSDLDKYEDLLIDFSEEETLTHQSDSVSGPDSLQHLTWYEQQKKEIAQERADLEKESVEFQTLRKETETLLERRATIERANLTSMAKLYEGMKTDEVVPILANLTDTQVSQIISKMKKQKASEVLGKMPPERAARITQYLISLEEEL